MKNKIVFFTVLVFSFLLLGTSALASTTNGTVTGYGWGENIGWVDFGSTAGAVLITDTAVTGYAYSENVGWINLTGVTNDNEGNLSGYAWGENIGWVDFSKVIIDNTGLFTGAAYSENVGWIVFGEKGTTNEVTTDWRPASSRSTGHTSSGSRPAGYKPTITTTVPTTTPTVNTPTNTPTTTATYSITKVLKYKMTDPEVKILQIYLNTHGYILATTGVGSLNHETNYFGLKTKASVIAFQKANKLTPDGIVGPITRGFIK